MAKLRIAVIAGVFPGWSTTFVLDQIGAALTEGHQVDVFALDPGPGDVNHPDIARFGIRERTQYFGFQHRAKARLPRLMLLGSRLARNPRLTLSMFSGRKKLRDVTDAAVFMPSAEYDVIHCHFGANALRILPTWQSGILRGGLLVTFHGFDLMRQPVPSYAPLFASKAKFTANTQFLKQTAVALGAAAEQVDVFPMGVDPSLYRPGQRSFKPGVPLTILSVARLIEFKGIEFGLRAVARLLSQGVAVRYDICGTGRLLGPLKELAHDLGIAKNVRFLGAQSRDQVIAAMQSADVFLLPGVLGSDGQCEAQGVVLLEAAACGLPVVASRIGGIPEVVVDTTTGFLTRPRDVLDLAARLKQLAWDPALRQGLGEAGRRHVLQNFDQRNLNQRLLASYEQLAAERRAF